MINESELIKKRVVFLIGIAFLILGLFILISVFGGITGNVIGVNVGETGRSIIGIISIILGILVFISSRATEENKKGELEKIVEEDSILSYVSKAVIKSEGERKKSIYLIDTSFIKQNERMISEWPEGFLKGYAVRIPRIVYEESVQRSSATNQPLIKRQALNRFIHLAGGYQDSIKDYSRDSQHTESIFRYWLDTKKGKLAGEYEKDRFRTGADSLILDVAWQRGDEPTFILSEDIDIKNVARKLRNDYHVNIHVLNTADLLYYIENSG